MACSRAKRQRRRRRTSRCARAEAARRRGAARRACGPSARRWPEGAIARRRARSATAAASGRGRTSSSRTTRAELRRAARVAEFGGAAARGRRPRASRRRAARGVGDGARNPPRRRANAVVEAAQSRRTAESRAARLQHRKRDGLSGRSAGICRRGEVASSAPPFHDGARSAGRSRRRWARSEGRAPWTRARDGRVSAADWRRNATIADRAQPSGLTSRAIDAPRPLGANLAEAEKRPLPSSRRRDAASRRARRAETRRARERRRELSLAASRPQAHEADLANAERAARVELAEAARARARPAPRGGRLHRASAPPCSRRGGRSARARAESARLRRKRPPPRRHRGSVARPRRPRGGSSSSVTHIARERAADEPSASNICQKIAVVVAAQLAAERSRRPTPLRHRKDAESAVLSAGRDGGGARRPATRRREPAAKTRRGRWRPRRLDAETCSNARPSRSSARRWRMASAPLRSRGGFAASSRSGGVLGHAGASPWWMRRHANAAAERRETTYAAKNHEITRAPSGRLLRQGYGGALRARCGGVGRRRWEARMGVPARRQVMRAWLAPHAARDPSDATRRGPRPARQDGAAAERRLAARLRAPPRARPWSRRSTAASGAARAPRRQASCCASRAWHAGRFARASRASRRAAIATVRLDAAGPRSSASPGAPSSTLIRHFRARDGAPTRGSRRRRVGMPRAATRAWTGRRARAAHAASQRRRRRRRTLGLPTARALARRCYAALIAVAARQRRRTGARASRHAHEARRTGGVRLRAAFAVTSDARNTATSPRRAARAKCRRRRSALRGARARIRARPRSSAAAGRGARRTPNGAGALSTRRPVRPRKMQRCARRAAGSLRETRAFDRSARPTASRRRANARRRRAIQLRAARPGRRAGERTRRGVAASASTRRGARSATGASRAILARRRGEAARVALEHWEARRSVGAVSLPSSIG